MGPPVNDFIEMEARFGANNYAPLGVVLSRGEGVFVWDRSHLEAGFPVMSDSAEA
jgi:acetylornithine/succinyldiaminopimelate/putrescine aminotransferase